MVNIVIGKTRNEETGLCYYKKEEKRTNEKT